MPRRYRGSGGLLAGVALVGVTLWLIRRRSEHGQEASDPVRSTSSPDSWLPDDVLDLPAESSLARNDDVLAEIFDRPRR